MAKITSVPPIMTNRNLVTKSQYNGVVLKLTKTDKEKITKLHKQKADYELELNKLIELSKKIKIVCKERIAIDHRRFSMESNIQIIEDMIKNIKTSRLAKQIAKIAKKA